jgi:hypothetical protein
MADIVINNNGNGTINIIYADSAKVAEAKDNLLHKMFYARDKKTMGGYAGWRKLIDMYCSFDYQGMYDYIESFKGKGAGGKTRNECLAYLKTIMKNNH